MTEFSFWSRVSARKGFSLPLGNFSLWAWWSSFTGLSWQSLSQREALERWELQGCEIKKNREEAQEAGLMHMKHKESLECSWSFLRRELTTHAAVWLQCQSVSSAAWCFGLWRKRLVCHSFLAGSVRFGSVLHIAPQQTWSGESRWQSQSWLDNI